MELFKRINLKQPKYMLPALVYFPLLFTGYFVIDTFHTKKAEKADPELQSTEYLNPTLPQAKVKDGLEGKYESMVKSYGKIDDFSAIGNIEREEDKNTEEYESKYTDSDLKTLDEGEISPEMTIEEQLLQSAERGKMMQEEDFPLALSERERQIQSQQREQQMQAELDAALATIRQQAVTTTTGVPVEMNGSVSENAVNALVEENETFELVKRIRQSSDYFHTISEADDQSKLIKAIIDENIKATDGSRVRLRLLDDVEVGSITMPKGSYLYATMNGFSGQRVKGTITSLLLGDELIKVSLSLYDTDGLEGLYVPESAFRETGKDVAGGALGSNMSFSQGSYDNVLSQWGMQAVQNAYQRTTSAVSKAVRKNSAKLKYGTFVYLINAREIKETK